MLWDGVHDMYSVWTVHAHMVQYCRSTRRIEQASMMQPLQRMLQKSRWRREPEEGIDLVRQKRIYSFDCLKCLSIEECRGSLRAMHLLSSTTFLRLGNPERIFVRVHSLGHEFVQTRNSMCVSSLIFSRSNTFIIVVLIIYCTVQKFSPDFSDTIHKCFRFLIVYKQAYLLSSGIGWETFPE